MVVKVHDAVDHITDLITLIDALEVTSTSDAEDGSPITVTTDTMVTADTMDLGVLIRTLSEPTPLVLVPGDLALGDMGDASAVEVVITILTTTEAFVVVDEAVESVSCQYPPTTLSLVWETS